jgi:hypothetical protein
VTDILHVHPRGDRVTIQLGGKTVRATIGHDTSTGEPDCVCGPEVRPEKREDGSMGWLIVHHSLDGRELDGGGQPSGAPS